MKIVAADDQPRRSRRYALLLAARDSEYVLKAYGGYFNVFVSAFGGGGGKDSDVCETWDMFRAVDGELPDLDDIGRYDGFVISGSPYDAFLDALQDLPQYAKITECHQDEVWEAPLGADALASSDKTGVEMFCVCDHVLGIQGHPEYTGDILLSLVYRLSTSHFITVSFAEDVKRQLKATSPDREFWLNLCKSFLKAEELY
uniref:Glutamine amidotransferase domain-containing protein n=1 Tax=Aegilops tauschii TaxID=37682 RepID=M8BE54_AEGTA